MGWKRRLTTIVSSHTSTRSGDFEAMCTDQNGTMNPQWLDCPEGRFRVHAKYSLAPERVACITTATNSVRKGARELGLP